MSLRPDVFILNSQKRNVICTLTVFILLSICVFLGEFVRRCTFYQGISLQSYKYTSAFHIVTGMMVIRNDSMTDPTRKTESGAWIIHDAFAKVPKSIYHLDYYHKHIQNSDFNIKHTEDKNYSLYHFLYRKYFSSALLSVPNLRIIPLENPVHAQECGYYLQYIVENYYQLADYSVFLHGNPQDHNPHLMEQLQWLITQSEEILHNNMEFLHLNCQEYVHRRSTEAGVLLALLGFDKYSFTSNGSLDTKEISSGMRYFASQCCAQFTVSSKLIRKYPLEFWKIALKVTLDYKRFCVVWEYMWHAIFLGVQEMPKHLTLDELYRKNNPFFSSKCPNGLRSDQA